MDQELLDNLSSPDLNPVKRVIIIDVENRPKDYKSLSIDNAYIYLVLSSGHPLIDKIKLRSDKHKILIVPTRHKNGADVGIVILVTQLISTGEYDEIIIISGDNFTTPMSDLLGNTSYLPITYPKVDVKAYRSSTHFRSQTYLSGSD